MKPKSLTFSLSQSALLFAISIVLLSSCEPSDPVISHPPYRSMSVDPDPDAKIYWENVSRIMRLADDNGGPATRAAESNPVLSKIMNQKIMDSKGNPVAYSELSSDDRNAFIDSYVSSRINEWTEKISLTPGIKPYVSADAIALNEAMSSADTRSGDLASLESILRLWARNDSLIYSTAEDNVDTRGPFGKFWRKQYNKTEYNNHPTELQVTQAAVKCGAIPGDVIVYLPSVMRPNSKIVNFGSSCVFGHAGIIEDIVFGSFIHGVECCMETGVSRSTISSLVYESDSAVSYAEPCSIIGFQLWVWTPVERRGRRSYVRTARKISSEPLLDKAETYIGKKYVRLSEFLLPKPAAPERFTCTSLVWWCAKKAMGIDLDPDLGIVYPKDLVLSENSYVKISVM